MILLKPVFVQEPTGRPEGTEEATARRQEVYDPVNSTATYFIIIICKYVFLFHIYWRVRSTEWAVLSCERGPRLHTGFSTIL